MRKRALIAFALAVVAGLAVTLALAATRESRLVYTLGVYPAGRVAVLQPGEEACQTPVAPPAESFDRVVTSLGTFGQPGPAVDVLVRATGSRRLLTRGRLRAGYPDIGTSPEQAIPVRPATLRERADVCLRNAGPRRVAVYGGAELAHRTSEATLDGQGLRRDLSLRLERASPRTLLSRLPSVFEHAARFKPSGVGPWTFWLLAVLALLAVPVLAGKALADAAASELRPSPAPTPSPRGDRRPAPD